MTTSQSKKEKLPPWHAPDEKKGHVSGEFNRIAVCAGVLFAADAAVRAARRQVFASATRSR